MTIKSVERCVRCERRLRLQITRSREFWAVWYAKIRLGRSESRVPIMDMGDRHHRLIRNGIDSRLAAADDKTNVEQSREGAPFRAWHRDLSGKDRHDIRSSHDAVGKRRGRGGADV